MSGNISSTARHLLPTAFVDTATSFRQSKNVVRLPSIYPKPISRANFLTPVEFTDGGGTTVPLSRGLDGFVVLRRYAEECAFSLSTQAQDHVWDLAEYKRVKPAHCPTGATSGGTGCEQNRRWRWLRRWLRRRRRRRRRMRRKLLRQRHQLRLRRQWRRRNRRRRRRRWRRRRRIGEVAAEAAVVMP